MTAKTDNRTNGGRFEQELAKILAEHGFWCHVLQQNKAGQPADIIAVKGKFHTLIDCKVISDDKGFPFSRIEENQEQAMKMFTKKGNELCYFALRLPDNSIRMICMSRIDTLRARGHKSITPRMMESQTWNFDDWLESSDTWKEDS